MVANFNPSWPGITAALRLAVIAAGGSPSVSIYPANWGGAIAAINDLKVAIIAAGSATSTMAAHVAAPDPHPQYAFDTDVASTNAALTSHTSNTGNPHSTTAGQVGAIPAAAFGAASGVATLDGSTKVPIGQLPTGTSSSTVAIGNDARLSDTRTPTDGTVTDAKVNAAAAIAWTKLSKSGAVAGDVGAATATQGTNADNHIAASANVHGLPASVNVLGNRTASGQFVQHGSATATGGGAWSFTTYRTINVTFPVAFTTTPRVATGIASGGAYATGAGAVTTSGCTLNVFGDSGISASLAANYIAIGS